MSLLENFLQKYENEGKSQRKCRDRRVNERSFN